MLLIYSVVPVIRELEESGDIKLVGIVNTHHHHDHSGANKELVSKQSC